MVGGKVARLLHLVSAGRITVVDDTGAIQKLQVQERPGADGSKAVADGVLRVAQFGIASSPPIGSEVVLVRLWGNRTLTLAIATNHQPSRLKNLQAGDSSVYYQRGAYLWFQYGQQVLDAAGGDVVVQNAAQVTIKATQVLLVDAPTLNCTGDVVADCNGAPVSLAKHLHPLQGPGAPETGAPLPQ